MSHGYAYSDLELKLRAACEAGFVLGPQGAGPYSATGETFTELTGLCSTAEGAYAGALAEFNGYAEGKGKTLYWRTFPEIQYRDKDETFEVGAGWATYMRLLVSDLPQIVTANKPDWLNSALTTSSAKITVNGDAISQ